MERVEFTSDTRSHQAGDVVAVDDGNRDHLQRMVSRGLAVDPDAPAVEVVATAPAADLSADEPEDPPADDPGTDALDDSGLVDPGPAEDETDFIPPDPD